MEVNMNWAAFIIGSSPLFDEQWYRKTYRISDEVNAAKHYLLEGAKKGWNPSKYFSTEEYFLENENVRWNGDNPLLHFEVTGHEQHSFPHIPLEIERKYKKCACCGHFIGRYAPLSNFYAEEAKKYHAKPWHSEMVNEKEYACPYCGSADRDRAYAVFLRRILPADFSGRVLDIAPSAGMRTLFQNFFPKAQYRTADLSMPGVDYQMDIMDMKEIDDDSIDVFICSHVLEHVRDDRQAMRELYRILSPQGIGILVVPMDLNQKEIDEDPDCEDIDERWRRFGQNDHIRKYSRQGYIDRVREIGFDLVQIQKEFFGLEAMYENALLETSTVYVVSKSE